MSLENRKTLLSELFEVLPCIARLEKELCPVLFDKEGRCRPLQLEEYKHDDEFYAGFATRLIPRLDATRDCVLL